MKLLPRDLAPYIDHTLLKPAATARDLEDICSQAVRFGFYGVCVNPSLISLANSKLKGDFSSVFIYMVIPFLNT